MGRSLAHNDADDFLYESYDVIRSARKVANSHFKPLLPRIYMIIEEINERFCHELWEQYPYEWDRIEAMAIIAHDLVKMAHLAIVGSHSVNGVAKIHTEILKQREMRLFYEFYPDKFNNKTNGIAHRRWLMKANPQLTNLISEAIERSGRKNRLSFKSYN